MRRDRPLTGVMVALGFALTGCQSSESPTSPSSPDASPAPTTSSNRGDGFENILTVGPPSADIPRFTVDGQTQTIVDWWNKLEFGQCQSLVDDTNTYGVSSDNERATYALAFLYRGVAFACLQEWSSAALNLEAAGICRVDLTSIGNSDQEQPLALLARATDYVEDHGVHVGGRNPDTTCGSEPTETPTSEVPSTATSSP
jgi:hypothetical protein